MFKAVTLIVRFVLELILLFSLGYWGFHLKGSFFLQFVVGLGLPVAAAIVWGLFISPKASGRVPLFAVLIMEAVLFAAAVLCLIQSGFTVFAVIFTAFAVFNRFIVLKWNMQEF